MDGGAAAPALSPRELEEALGRVGAIQDGHFLLTSGRHGDRFFLLPVAFQYPDLAAEMGRQVADLYRGCGATAVVGPATGGIILAHEVARRLGVRSLFADKAEGGRMVLRRGFALSPGERVLVVEDVITTGGSVRKTIAAIEAFRPEIVGVAAVVDRSGGRADCGASFRTVLSLEARDWDPAECPLCREGQPLAEPKAMAGSPAGSV